MPLVDYSQITEFAPVEEGIYNARLTKHELVMPKTSDKFPYYKCEFTLEADEEKGVTTRQKVWKNLSLSPAALFMFKHDMLVLGANPEDLSPGSQVDTDDVIASCLEAPCRLKLSKIDYPKNDGSTGIRNEIVEVMAELPF